MSRARRSNQTLLDAPPLYALEAYDMTTSTLEYLNLLDPQTTRFMATLPVSGVVTIQDARDGFLLVEPSNDKPAADRERRQQERPPATVAPSVGAANVT